MGTRLGLDIGTNSIGWWLYATDGGEIAGVLDGGVRIFSDGRDPKSKASLAVDRRMARGMRRRRDRYLRRRAALMKRMADAGLMPADPQAAKALELLDPYELRARGLDEALPLPHFGRALFHLNQRRGFKSNRKTDRGDNESGKIKDATRRLDQEMAVAIKDESKRTLGAFLHMRRQKTPEKPLTEPKENKDHTRKDYRRTPSVRTRMSVAVRGGPDAKAEEGYDFYPDRRHLSEEFDKLWAVQARFHPEVLTDDLRDEIRLIIFHQRRLKVPKVGLCLFTEEERLPAAHPLNQRRILYETVNALRVTAPGEAVRALTREERDQIIHALDNRKHTKSLSGMALKLKALGKTIGLRSDQHFTLETANRDSIACDPVRASLSDPRRFGPGWSALDDREQWRVVRRVRNVQGERCAQVVVDWLIRQHGLPQSNAWEVLNAPLPEGYGRLGRTATTRILAALEAEVIPYSAAVARCGWHHSDERTGEVLTELPYYGKILERHVIPGTYEEKDDDITRYGRITNPTVHIGLNQLRRLVNRIITVHGRPDEIVVELARDLKRSEDQKREMQREIRENTKEAIRRGEKLDELGVRNTGENRMVLRLWEDLNPEDCLKRFCPYSGQRISASMLFDGSCDVDHILPYSRTLDDSFANRTLCLKEYNRQKSNKTPWEVWGETAQWATIEANLKNLPKNKAWRFAPDAMEKFEGERDFEARALKDTQYLSRIARTYLSALYDGADGKSHVWVVPGRLTEMLRRHWGLNALLSEGKAANKAKNRTDHRHHAIDAAVIAATDRSLIQRISKMAKRDELAGAEEVARAVPAPWEDFRDDIAAQLARITVSHRADHGRIDPQARKSGRDSTSCALHQETAYGLTGETDPRGVPLVVTRKPLSSLTPALIAREAPGKGGMIRDAELRRRLAVATKGKEGKAFEAAIQDFVAKPGAYQGTRHVRVVEPIGVAPIHNGKAKPAKSYATSGNHRYEVWRMPDGKIVDWVVPNFYAHKADLPTDARPATPATCLRPHPAARLLLKLQKNDMVRLRDASGALVVATVEKFSSTGIIEMVPHSEANAADRYSKDKSDNVYIRKTANTLLKAEARRVYVDEMGRVRDPGKAG
ncbi:MAG: type II CRISPR RNA-guided endonuclease Cas9 [Rhodobacterales bacterium]|nr:MAG: type II CRISPR RNA-guided endonuclease Cas9 [Rhodobacterales bacterium]